MRTVTPQQWERISQLFAEASQIPPGQRDAYLAEACPDEAIRREVLSLLAQPRRFLGIDCTVTGRTLRQYRILEQIGHGSMGQVYKAHDMSLDRIVALKLVPSDVRSDPSFRDRLIREAKSASRLDHPNIVVIHEIAYDEKQDLDFIVMEYIPGKTLHVVTPAEGLPVDRARDYALQIASALAFAHDSGVLHGDLKPTNIMVTEQHRIKLLDFGLARTFKGEIGDPRQSDIFGTIRFMAPERQGARLTDPRSEIFTFGLILHQMLSGEHPFGTGTADEASAAIRNERHRPLPAEVPPWLSSLVDRCLEKKIEARIQSMQNVHSELKHGALFRSIQVSTPRLEDQPQVEDVRAFLGRLSYANVARSRQALAELSKLLAGSAPPAVREAAISALADVIFTVPDDLSRSARTVRQLTLDALRASIQRPLRESFDGGALEGLDLYGMNFASADLSGTCFNGCFLVEADFRGSKLARALFVGACVRNVDFAEADLSDADFKDGDWFNARGLTPDQLGRARRETLRPCPPDVRALRRYLDARYVYPYTSWATHVQEQLNDAWNQYLKPGGLRDSVAAWQRTSR